jgi:hypothetical protein
VWECGGEIPLLRHPTEIFGVSGQLLCDRTGPFNKLTRPDIFNNCPDDAIDIDIAVFEKVSILYNDQGGFEMVGDHF